MKNILILILLNVNAAISYVINPVDGAEGYVEGLNFDSQGNIYVSTRQSPNHTIHKLSPTRELLWAIDIPSDTAFTRNILVNNQDDVYFCFVAQDPVLNLGILRAGTTDIQQVARVTSTLFFVDNDGNLYYGKEPGVRVLRPNSTVPVIIKNLENSDPAYPNKAVLDGDGNVYFGVRDENFKYSIAFITKQASEEDVPSARLFKIVMDNGSQYVEDYFVDEENQFWLFLNDAVNHRTAIRKLTNDSFENVLIDGEHPDMDGIPGKDKIYVVGYSYWYKTVGTVFYLSNDEIVEIPELQNLTLQQYFKPKLLSDGKGYVYLQTDKELTPELGSMVVFRPDEEHPIPIGLNSTHLEVIDHLVLDHNNDIWILPRMNEVYFLKKGETEWEKIEDFRGACHDVKSNLITKEIFFVCERGLYVAENEP